MDIVTAFKYRQCGYRIRRRAWSPLYYLNPRTKISNKDVLADDWEVITEGIVKDFPIEYLD